MTKLTKTSVTLSVMAANANAPMKDVVPLIVQAQHAAGFGDVTEARAAGAYRWAVREGMAPGEAAVRKTAVAKEVAVKAVKAVKEAAPKKSAEEIEAIKAANLSRMKNVLAKRKGNKATETPAAEAPTAEADTFSAPESLTREEVTALVG